jgi:hypothetical protein
VNPSVGDPPRTAIEVRDRIQRALERDLVGPGHGHPHADEMLPGRQRPSNWYLTGFLVPVNATPEESADEDSDEEIDAAPEREASVDDAGAERTTGRRSYFPSSIGLSMLVPASVDQLDVDVHWGDYALVPRPSDAVDTPADVTEPNPATRSRTGQAWRRAPREQAVSIPLGDLSGSREPIPVPGSAGLTLQVLVRPLDRLDAQGTIPPGTRAVSVFLVNDRVPDPDQHDRAYAFQPELVVRCPAGLVGRPNLRPADGDWDEQVAALHYADTPEFATGHGISADWDVTDGRCATVRTRWLPAAEVQQTIPAAIDDMTLSMDALAELSDTAAVTAALSPMVDGYRAWIKRRQAEVGSLSGEAAETAAQLLSNAELAASRIERGIATLCEDELARDAFRVANRAVARALRRRNEIRDPAWRPFQLAFVLINLTGLSNSDDPEREVVDLLYFPTGGGKTEAYLGLAAFAIVLRRLRHPEEDGLAGAGVSVIMRYTLRLLTLDQLARAAGMVCALELEREVAPDRYGSWPFEIGLWVGQAATANAMGHKGDGAPSSARTRVLQYKADPRSRPSPIPLEECPWCRERFTPDSFSLTPDADRPRELQIVCTNWECDFTRDRPLPIVSVDEPLYRRAPAFIIATVDKFATLPWIGASGALLGGATRYDPEGFYGPTEPGRGRPLPTPLLPPDLIIQDELHLISGPLGTMVGLYEAAVDGLCRRGVDGQGAGPKIVASTATVRQAADQIQALFARAVTQVFPPPGPDRRDSFFAQVVAADDVHPSRRYLGVAAPGRNPKVVMRKTWIALMSAAERCYRDAGGHRNPENPADGYMTVLGYFNSLRELGGARRIVEEEIRNTIRSYGYERRRLDEPQTEFQDRRTFTEVVELTSRVSTSRVADARRRLGLGFDAPDRVDCALATNMISVGLDIPRLGLMSVIGQPKSAAEYIQATSRVGRSSDAPGLVVTLLSVGKPRDRSHFERFRHFHETFYRAVEVGSVTPFSARALDRGLVGTLVALSRHLAPELTPATGAERLATVRLELEQQVRALFERRLLEQAMDEDERAERARGVQDRIVDLLDSWQAIISGYAEHGVEVRYQLHEGPSQPQPLLHEMLDTTFESEHHRKFRVNRSLRSVEPSVNLFLREPSGAPVEGGG